LKFLFIEFKKLFLEVFEEYKHPDIVSHSGIPLELDFFYPKLNIAFEYQVLRCIRFNSNELKGSQHYITKSFHHNLSSLEERKLIDQRKVELCKEKGKLTSYFSSNSYQELH
jgi:hypothetical protein